VCLLWTSSIQRNTRALYPLSVRDTLRRENSPQIFPIHIEDAFDIRADSDYQDFYTISKDDVQQQVENAKGFLEAVQNYIDAVLEGQE
jgi:hypothetical protein